MQSLKKKFGKFAVSNDKAKTIGGGVLPAPSIVFDCVSGSGRIRRPVRTANGAARFVQRHGGHCKQQV